MVVHCRSSRRPYVAGDTITRGGEAVGCYLVSGEEGDRMHRSMEHARRSFL
jgi:hypothetical protein